MKQSRTITLSYFFQILPCNQDISISIKLCVHSRSENGGKEALILWNTTNNVPTNIHKILFYWHKFPKHIQGTMGLYNYRYGWMDGLRVKTGRNRWPWPLHLPALAYAATRDAAASSSMQVCCHVHTVARQHAVARQQQHYSRDQIRCISEACRPVATSLLLLDNMLLLANNNIIHETTFAASAKHTGLLLRPYCC